LAEVTLPSLGESVTEGIITQWFKKVGEAVARDEALFEVSTDKVDSEMPSPAAGVLTAILAAEGDTVETGAVVAIIDENGVPGEVAATPAPATAPSTPATTAAPKTAPAAGEAGIVVSPVVRRILADGGVEVSTVRGSGVGGAITRRDAERAVAQGPTQEVVHELSKGQRRMGAHMSASALSAPQGFVAIEVNADVFDHLPAVTADGHPVAEEVVLGLAVVRALRDFPLLNAAYVNDQVVEYRTVNLGFSRSMDDGSMLVPVVHATNDLRLSVLARRVAELDERLAAKQLTADDLMGGTISVASAPSAHTLVSVPVLLQPQVAGVSFGAVRHVPVVKTVDGQLTIVIGHSVVLGLTFDHRVCDAVVAASFLERVGALLAALDPTDL
jgi:2-oxoglutarate dehydrogenase E2 component (dihydrolipoamide succinyltransferase)